MNYLCTIHNLENAQNLTQEIVEINFHCVPIGVDSFSHQFQISDLTYVLQTNKNKTKYPEAENRAMRWDTRSF